MLDSIYKLYIYINISELQNSCKNKISIKNTQIPLTQIHPSPLSGPVCLRSHSFRITLTRMRADTHSAHAQRARTCAQAFACTHTPADVRTYAHIRAHARTHVGTRAHTQLSSELFEGKLITFYT